MQHVAAPGLKHWRWMRERNRKTRLYHVDKGIFRHESLSIVVINCGLTTHKSPLEQRNYCLTDNIEWKENDGYKPQPRISAPKIGILD
ncbi:MAG: hypothetical protein ACL7BU_15700 [Candidatus Phlomobacter fragariae]